MRFKNAQKKAVAKFDNLEFIENIKEEDSTMLKHLDILKQINECGYLTTNSQAGRKTETIYERAYILGCMLEKDAKNFINNISINTDKIAINIETNAINWDSQISIPLSIEKVKNKWKVFTHMSTTVPPKYFWAQQTSLDINNSHKVLYILCFDPKWNRNGSSKKGLFTDVLKILKSI